MTVPRAFIFSFCIWIGSVVVMSAMPPNRAGALAYQTDGTYTYFVDPGDPTMNLVMKVARSKPITLYRIIRDKGIVKVLGAEILLPGLPPAAVRHISAQLDHLEVIDTAVGGTTTSTSWDISALTNPYLPPPAKAGDDTSWRATMNDESELQDVRWRHEETFVVHINAAGEAEYNGDLSRARLGSVFVDGENRLFFTPPNGTTLFYAKPEDIYEIRGVTHVARKGIIVFEWTRKGEEMYHMESLEAKTRHLLYNFALEDDLTSHKMLTWIDDHRLLSQFVAHMFSEYTVIDLRRRTAFEETTDNGGSPVIVKNGRVRHYHFSDPSH